MIYKKFQNIKLSALGMGGMRFPVKDDDYSNIDKEKVEEMVSFAIKEGINYFDTAWGYHNGNSEVILGEVLSKYPRGSYYLASKFPGYDTTNMNKIEEIFETQLKKCNVEYFDFYLFHNVCEKNIDLYLDEKYGLFNYLMEQKKRGRIRHLGFSTHATLPTLKRFLDAYGNDMEFCQIQLNYLDYKMQNAKGKVELLNKLNIPIFVMEPVRGGTLAHLDEEYENMLKSISPNVKIVEWAFRFVESVPGVCVTLSGMSNMEQLKQNIATFDKENQLSQEEMKCLFSVVETMTSKSFLPCTSCKYCTTYCPKGLDIPSLIELYNEYVFMNESYLAKMVIESLPENKRPSSCLECHACEAVCPQNIKISEMMKDFVNRLNKKS